MYCSSCGTQISESARFCPACGGGINRAPRGAPRGERAQDIGSPGKAQDAQLLFQPAPSPEAQGMQTPAKAPAAAKQTSQETEKLPGGVTACVQGELCFDYAPPPILGGLEAAANPATGVIGPFKLLLGGFVQLVQGFKGALKDKRRLIPALAFAAVWIVLTLLPALGVTPPGGRLLSWLTFAQGGTRGGIAGSVGGVFGKGLFVSVIMGLFARKDAPKEPNGILKEISRLLPAGRGDIGVLTAGAGVALFGYNLMTGDNSLQNSIIGIVAAVASLRSMLSRSGYLRRLIAAFGQKLSKGRDVSSLSLSRFTAGMAGGFVFAVPLSVLGIPCLGYVLGGVMCIAGAAVALTVRPANPKGVAV
jgi:hypothetical protein